MGDERGFALVEVMVVVAIMLLLTFGLLDALDGFGRAEQHAGGRADQTLEVRAAAALLARDLASADDLVAAGAGVAPASNLSLATTDAAGTAVTVRWRLDGAVVRRDVLAANGTTSATRAVLREPATVAVRYFRPDGAELVPAVTTAAQLAACSARIHVDLLVGTVGGTADVALRTRVPSGSC